MKLLYIAVILFLTTIVNAQTQPHLTKSQVDSLPNTIKNEFIKIYRKSNNWQEYKMIKKTVFLNFQKRVIDSVDIFKKNILLNKEIVKKQEQDIANLKEQILKTNEELDALEERRDGILLFGIQMSKVAYSSLLWSIILILLVGVLFLLFKFKNGNSVTKEKIYALNELEDEFEQFRKRTLEKEQKLRRQLHDEVNKNNKYS